MARRFDWTKLSWTTTILAAGAAASAWACAGCNVLIGADKDYHLAGEAGGGSAGNGGSAGSGGSAGNTGDGGAVTGGCAANEVLCESGCADVISDPSNCGECGTLCGAGEACAGGLCVCDAGYFDCGAMTGCVDLLSDPSNCGICGTSCQGSECVMGACSAIGCGAGGQQCTSDSDCCEGACLQGLCECPMGRTLCAMTATCADLSIDPGNCGACYKSCGTGVCVMGQCQCPMGYTLCQGGCAKLSSDPENCGMCGAKCAMNETCLMGQCF